VVAAFGPLEDAETEARACPAPAATPGPGDRGQPIWQAMAGDLRSAPLVV